MKQDGAFSERTTIDRVAFSIRETARKVGVSAYTVRQAIKDGELYVKRCGRRVVVPASAIETWLSNK